VEKRKHFHLKSLGMFRILYIKATVVSVCLSMVTNMAGQGQGKAGQGDQGKHPPTRPVGGSQQLSGWQG
jgi:hypothetical protein